jgi:hypothetical protein
MAAISAGLVASATVPAAAQYWHGGWDGWRGHRWGPSFGFSVGVGAPAYGAYAYGAPAGCACPGYAASAYAPGYAYAPGAAYAYDPGLPSASGPVPLQMTASGGAARAP